MAKKRKKEKKKGNNGPNFVIFDEKFNLQMQVAQKALKTKKLHKLPEESIQRFKFRYIIIKLFKDREY